MTTFRVSREELGLVRWQHPPRFAHQLLFDPGEVWISAILSRALEKVRAIDGSDDPDAQCKAHGCARWRCEAEHDHPLTELLARHLAGDWGSIPPDDAAKNREALARGGRLMSAYVLQTSVTIWVITEADRSATTFLLPHEY